MTTTIEQIEKLSKQVETMTALAKANCEANASLKKFYDRLREDYDTEVEGRCAAEAALQNLREAAAKACVVCGGKGSRRTRCSMCHDSTWDHVCDDEVVPCEACAPLRAALAAVPADLLGRVRAEALSRYHDWKTEICPGDCGHTNEEECMRLYKARLRAETLLEAAAAVESHTGEFNGYKATEARSRAADMLRGMATGGKA